ncbi:hypothetical protein ACFV9P_26315 [Streptomyces sp. NPDC059892]|uniref:hypothetical protein n=1 Tax=unclassified Streptomyces TaxID=2593676 RepID=UPI00364B5F1F
MRSNRPGLRFTALLAYTFTPPPEQKEPPLHPHAVARSHLREQASLITSDFRPLDFREAEDAVNTMLAAPLHSEPRLVIEAGAHLSLDDETEALAQRQEHTEQRLVAADHDESVRLDLLRTRLLDPRLGLVSWLDRHADLLPTPAAPDNQAAEVISAFDVVHAALLRRLTGHVRADSALVHARVDELLAALENPATAERAAGILEQLVQVIHGEPSASP